MRTILAALLIVAIACLASPAAEQSKRAEAGRSEDVKQAVDFTARLDTLSSQAPRGMSKDAWRRHVAVARYYQMLLVMGRSPDEHAAAVLKNRKAHVDAAARQLAEIVGAMEAGKDIFANRRGAFLSAYISTADDSGQPYVCYVPENYDASKAWPLSVSLHGAGETCGSAEDFGEKRAYLAARVDGRGIGSNYVGLSENDVIEVIRDMQLHYRVDPSRVTITGVSMGGMGTWAIASRYCDLFAGAASYCGAPASSPIENLANLPLWLLHDDADWAVVIDRERWAVRLLKSWGYPARMSESHGFGHDAPAGARAAGLKVAEWLLLQHRPDAPERIVYTTDTPRRGKVYWVTIREFTDPSLPATVRVKASSRTRIDVDEDNVTTLEVELPDKLFDRKAAIDVAIDGATVRFASATSAKFFLHKNSKGWECLKDSPVRPHTVRAYDIGALANMYSGEPLLVVQGTAGGQAIVAAMARLAGDMRSYTSPLEPMDFATIPMMKDTEVTDEDIRTRNLILIGGPAQNCVTRRVADKLAAVERGGKVILAGSSYDLAGRGYTLYHYNPLAPERLIYVISSGEAAFYDYRFGLLDTAVANGRAFDFALMDVKPMKIIRLVSWNRDWRPAARFADSPKLAAAFGTPEGYWREFAAALRRVAKADYAFCANGPNNPRSGISFDASSARGADLELFIGRQPVVAADVTGAEVLQIAGYLEGSGEGHALPAVARDKVKPARKYRIVMTDETNRSIARLRKKNIDELEFVTFRPAEGLEGSSK